MLKITIPETDLFDEKNQEFILVKETHLQLEHSLVSLSKWESKWCKAFLSKEAHSYDETVDYIKCMTLTQNVNPNVYLCLTDKIVSEINRYIELPMTATFFPEQPSSKPSREIITAELIYYWMISLNIPFECQKWHLNRLLALIRVCNIKNQPPKKRSKREIMSRNMALNEQRKKQLHTKG